LSAPVQEHVQRDVADNQNINVSAAFVRALGHLAQDFGVVLAGALIWAFPYESVPLMQLAVPIATVLFSIIGLIQTFSLIRSSVRVLMEGVPEGFETQEIAIQLAGIDGVTDVHDLHCWGLTVDRVYLSVHLTLANDARIHEVLDSAHLLLKKNNVHHSTIQTEFLATVKHHDRGIMCQNYEIPRKITLLTGVNAREFTVEENGQGEGQMMDGKNDGRAKNEEPQMQGAYINEMGVV